MKKLISFQIFTLMLVILFVQCGFFNNYCYSKDLKVMCPADFPGIHPNDSLTTNYSRRYNKILEYAYPDESAHCQKMLDDLKVNFMHDLGGLESFPYRFRRVHFNWDFDVNAFETQMAVIKTTARQFFSAKDIVNSIKNADDAMKNKQATLLPAVPIKSYIDSLSVEPFLWIDINSEEVKKLALEKFIDEHPYKIIERDGKKIVHLTYMYGGKGMDFLEYTDIKEITDHWKIGEPITAFNLLPCRYNGLPLSTDVIVPVYKDSRVFGTVTYTIYLQKLMSYTDIHQPANLGKFPPIDLKEAIQMVENRTGETVKKAIYGKYFGTSYIPIPVILTTKDNIYIIDPLIHEVW